MEINIYDIPEEGLQISASEKDAWFADALAEAIGGGLASSVTGNFIASLTMTEGNINVAGSGTIHLRSACDRCLVEFDSDLSINFNQVLAPLYENKRQKKLMEEEEVELSVKDLDFAYYEGDSLDLSDMVREQIAMAMPVKYLCREDCKGLCQRCGQNFNEGSCDCRRAEIDPRWEALKGIKVKGG